MAYTHTPLRQLERLYGSILRAASQLTRVSESSERQEQLAMSRAAEITGSIDHARSALTERIDAGFAQLGQLQTTLPRLAESTTRPHSQDEQYLAELRASIESATPGNPATKGWRSYSQCDEDGIIRECLRRIGQATPLSRTFIEVGCSDGLENNTHQLVLDGFAGCWLDGDVDKIHSIERGLGSLQMPGLMVRHAFVTRESIDGVIRDCRAFLGTDDVDFYSFDIDGSDTHLVRASLKSIRPKLVCVEYNAKSPPPTRLEMDYRDDHRWSGDDYFGASLQSWVDVLDGYKLVSCNLSGVNAFFVREDFAHCFADHGIDALYQSARYWLVGQGGGHPASLRWMRQAVQRASIDRPWVIEARVPGLPAFPFEIHRRADQYISGDLARTNIWEPFETDVFRRLCRQGDFVLDIGANIGWYAAVASMCIGPEGRLVCFEPDPSNHAMLTRNVERCAKPHGAELIQGAVSDVNGSTALYLSGTNLGDHRIFDDGSGRPAIEVSMRSLDSFFEEAARLPDFVKSDTQGSEARIIAGAQGLLAKGWRPIFLFEFWPHGLAHAGDDPLQLFDELDRRGYEMFVVSEAIDHLPALDRHEVARRVEREISASSGAFFNILALPVGSGRKSAIRDLIR